MLIGGVRQFNYLTGNATGTRVSSISGTQITPGTSGSYGSYTEVLASGSIARDCYMIDITIHRNAQTAEARDTVFTLGIDTAGGTAWVDWIPDLLAPCAPIIGSTALAVGINYRFPLYVKAGSSIACKAATESATARTPRVIVSLFGDPSNTANIRAGMGVEAIGVSGTGGTAVTSGTTSEGAWTSLGTTTKNCFYWQQGFGVSNATMATLSYTGDIAADNDGTTPNKIQEDVLITTTNGEICSLTQFESWQSVKGGETMYGRLQCSGTPDSGISMAAYGVF